MNKETYFKLMSETTRVTKPVIREALESIKDNKLKRTVFFYPRNRFENQKLFLRPLLIRLSYEAAGGKNWEEIAPVYAAYELLNISTYQSNLSFDRKQGIVTTDKINNQFIASMVTRELSQKLIYEKFNNSFYHEKILNSLNHVNFNIYEGQFYDLNILHMKNWKNFETMNEFMDAYINKCLYLSGIFFEECAYVGAILGGNENDIAMPLRRFGRNFGVGLHIVNDIADFLPLNTADEKDSHIYSDLRNYRLTLPVYYLLRYGDKSNRSRFMSLLDSGSLTTSKCAEMAKIIINDDAIIYARKIAKIFMKKAKQHLAYLRNKENSAYFSIMASVLKTNKYFNYLTHIRDDKAVFDAEALKVMEGMKYEYHTN